MNSLLNAYERRYGYRPSINELYDLYTQGSLQLTDNQENALLQAVAL